MRELLVQGVATALDRRPEPLARFLRRRLGDDAVVVEERSEPDRGRWSMVRTLRDRGCDARCWPKSRRTTWGDGAAGRSSGVRYVTLPFVDTAGPDGLGPCDGRPAT